jgi:tRNA (guanosine-2'-O-)-methyltransferase
MGYPVSMQKGIPVTEERYSRVKKALSQRLGSVVAIAESVHRRHNTSAILRSCEAFGIHEVHLIGGENFKAVEGAARGAERWIKTSFFPELESSVAGLKARGFQILVADLVEPAFSPETVPVDKPVAVIFGSEARGVSKEARALADGAICIPMVGLTASLNVSVSAAIILRTLAERRRALVGNDLESTEQERFLNE